MNAPNTVLTFFFFFPFLFLSLFVLLPLFFLFRLLFLFKPRTLSLRTHTHERATSNVTRRKRDVTELKCDIDRVPG